MTAYSTLTQHLKKRGNRYYAQVHVPRHLVERAGATEFIKALGTSDLIEANRRKHPVVAEFFRRIRTLERSGSDPFREVHEQALETAHGVRAQRAAPRRPLARQARSRERGRAARG